jgi:hypothetical protein
VFKILAQDRNWWIFLSSQIESAPNPYFN